MPPKCENYELVSFLEERKRSAKNPGHRGGSGDRWTHIYGKAIVSIRKYPLPILSGAEAQTLDGIGPFIAKLIDDFIAGKDVSTHGGKRRKTDDGPPLHKKRKPSSTAKAVSSSPIMFPMIAHEDAECEDTIGMDHKNTREERRSKLYKPRCGTVAWSILIAMRRRMQRIPEEDVFSRRGISQLSADVLNATDVCTFHILFQSFSCSL
jgi:hypothetical protein